MQKEFFSSSYISYSYTLTVFIFIGEKSLSLSSKSRILNEDFSFKLIFIFGKLTKILLDKSCPIGRVLF